MNYFWLWLAVTFFLSLVVVLIVSKTQSRRIVNAGKYKKPLTVFPDFFNLSYENVSFTSSDGAPLKGWFIPSPKETDKTIILLHGRGSNKAQILPHTFYLNNLNFNLFYFDFRCCGESGGGLSSIGYLENKDFEGAVSFLKKYKPEAAKYIGIYSTSMGASVGIYQAAKMSEIKCLVAEAAFDSYEKAVAQWAWIYKRVPYYPFIPLTLFFVRLKLKTNPEKVSPIYHIDKLKIPVFFIHGSHDELVPPVNAKNLFKKANEPKNWWLVAGAEHGKCAEVGGKEYKEKLSEFFKTNL